MSRDRAGWSRRDFLSGLSLVGAAGLTGLGPAQVAAEPPPETARLKIGKAYAVCVAPQFVAEELLRGEGFTDVQYLTLGTGRPLIKAVAAGDTDIGINTAGQLVAQMDEGGSIVVLAGTHVGCYELFGGDHIRSVSDLKGKTVAVPTLESGHYFVLATMMAHIGLDPRKDIRVVTQLLAESGPFLARGKLDALVAFPPEPQELRAKKIGHVVVDTILDRPWSQYFCCLVYANKEFVRRHPVATKRALRAFLKATDVCAAEPERAARLLVDKGYTPRYDYALQALKDIPYARWREYDPEDTIRFYALRLREAGMIKSSPQKIIAQGTDWRFLNELKKELKT
jgi:NitT/TauT family transport system substrate-binding protein